MRVAMFSTKKYDQDFFGKFNQGKIEFTFLYPRLDINTAILSRDHEAVCCFVNDHLDADVLKILAEHNIKLVALRCAGFNNVDLEAAQRLGIKICRVPEYSPYAVAEHTVALILDLNRNIHRAHNRVRENDYSLDGLLGFDLHGKTIGVIGGGKIGQAFIKIMLGFGCKILLSDPGKPQLNDDRVTRCDLDTLFKSSDIISLHCPLTPDTHYIINESSLNLMRKGVMIINTGRGGLIDTKAVIQGLKSGHVGYLGIDVYEEEADIFFEDLSNTAIQDDVFARLQTFPNVTITGHQAFFTSEALERIASTTINNLLNAFSDIASSDHPVHWVE